MRIDEIASVRLDQVEISRGAEVWQHHLQIASGQILMIKGPSGCGKTTLLEAVAGFVPLRAGQIWVNRQRIDHLPAEKRPVSLLFQQQNFFEHLSVQQNLALGFDQARPSDQQWQAIHAALKALDVEGLLDRRPGQLSGGQRQRLALLRCVLRPRPLVLLDEPFSALDDVRRQQAAHWLKQQVQATGQVVFLVSHRQQDADELADQLLLM